MVIYIGSILIVIWGIAHLVPTKSVVNGFGSITADNKKIIIMEWIAEGVSLIFAGVLILAVSITSGLENLKIVRYYVAGFLIVLAVISLFTGARTKIIPMKLCPLVKTIAAILIIL